MVSSGVSLKSNADWCVTLRMDKGPLASRLKATMREL